MTRVLSGIQPSGEVHLGNYLGAIRRWADEQDRVDGYFCIVDLHAITLPQVPAELRQRTLELATTLFAAGIDPDRSTLFVQSHVHEHSELAWILNCVASMGELNRMVQWKEKSADKGEHVSVGLFDYPVLQAADILLYQADEVPVGEDQRQHVELTRDIAQRFNHRFGETFNLPEATHPPVAARVMDLQSPTSKMSKSIDSPKGTVLLLDDPDRIAKKIKSAVTDSGTEVAADRETKAGITNLIELLAAVTGDEIDTIEARYAGQMYGTFKADVAEAVVEFVRPVQERYHELAADPGAVSELLAKGADKAAAVASVTLARAKDAVGFLPGYR
ncbi:MAG: tryptophan--tRNA ligase [Actinobacteria bacterium]|nr:tryptophan--tRNA ligase [Actinomycetota bacterium]